jgi:hypothetical protein
MKSGATLFLRAVVLLIGIGAVALLLWEPHIEGRNAHATVFAIYFNDPFLAYAYVASIPFFVGLFHAFKVLGFAGRNNEFSLSAVKVRPNHKELRDCAFRVCRGCRNLHHVE